MSVRYLLAKYIPDIQRFEPVNIGVIVWSNGSTRARFYGEIYGRPGQISGGRVPKNWPLPAYRQWVAYWCKQLDQGAITPATGGKPVSKTSSEFIDVLTASNRGNFLLSDGGIVLDDVGQESLSELAEDLFCRLVEDPSKAEERYPSLQMQVNLCLEEAGLKGDSNLIPQFSVECQIGNFFEKFEFSYAYKNGSLRRLYQTVPLGQSPKTNRKNIHDSCWMFEKVVKAKVIDQQHGAAIISVGPELLDEAETRRMIEVLESTTRVLNIEVPGALFAEFSSLPSLAGH